jgi:hypothetical protein
VLTGLLLALLFIAFSTGKNEPLTVTPQRHLPSQPTKLHQYN